MAIACHFWDMDHTLIDNDCDVSWKEFLIAGGLAPASARDLAESFFQDYLAGKLVVADYLRFQLEEFRGRSEADLRQLCRRHFESMVRGKIYETGRRMLERQRACGEETVLITSTNRFIAEPVAAELGFKTLMATELEVQDGRFTGALGGVYCLGLGKIGFMEAHLARRGLSLAECAYYGDSSNDIAILERVGHPFAVNPGAKLRATALERQWTILDF
ncbi:MAG: hypothetical protein RL095_2350 [Verrucomicrobiota bacterium]